MSLKNWTITAESVKKGREGLIAYYNYLSSQSEHEGQEITALNRKQNLFNLVSKADKFNLARKLTKGGRPSNYAWSAVLSYPFELKLGQLAKIEKLNMERFIKYISDENDLGLSDNEINRIVLTEVNSFVHSGGGVNNHIHCIVPKHFQKLIKGKNKKTIVSIDLSKKKYLHRLKLINNEVINEVAGIDLLDYQLESHKKHKKRMSKTKYKAKREYEAKTALNADRANELYQHLESLMIDYYNRYEETGEHDEEALKQLNRAKKQLENGNTDRAEKTLQKVKYPKPRM